MTRASLSATERMSFDDFMAFARERPDGERWELVDGLPVLNASPTDFHQVIVVNLTTALMNAKARRSADWIALPGHTVRVLSEGWAPNPDVVVRSDRLTGQVFTAEPIIAFEVASPSNRRADRLRLGSAVAGLSVTLLVLAALRVLWGAYQVTPADFVRILSGQTIAGASFIVLEEKLPRAVAAMLAGAALGASGALYRRTLRNPLASPDILGVTTGAAAAAFGGYLREIGKIGRTARFTISQGTDMGRPSSIEVSVIRGEPGVRVRGSAREITDDQAART